MANETAALVVALSASLSKFQKDMQTASDMAGEAAKGIETTFSNMNPDASKFMNNFADAAKGPAQSAGVTIGTALLAGFGVAIATIVQKMGSLIDGLAKIGDRADELRLPVNLLQALSVAADQARVPQDALNKALDKFTEVSKKTKDGAEEFYTALRNIGTGFVTAFEKAPTQAARLDVLANALKSTTDEVKRAQLATAAFGTDNERFISILAEGAPGINDAKERMKALGLEIDEAAVKRAQEARSNLSLLARVIGDELSSALGALVPTLSTVVPLVQALSKAVTDFFAAFQSADKQPVSILDKQIQAIQKDIEQLQAQNAVIESGGPKGVGEPGSFQQGFNTWVGAMVTKLSRQEDDLVLAANAKRIEELKKQLQDLKDAKDFQETAAAFTAEAGTGAPKPTGPGAFKGRPSLIGPGGVDPFETQVNSINRHIAALNADAAAVGKTVAEHEALRTEVSLLQAIQRAGGEVTQEQIDRYAVLRGSMSQLDAQTTAGIVLNKEHADSFTSVSARMLQAASAADLAKRQYAGLQSAIQFGGNQLIDIMDGLRNKTLSAADAMKNLTNNLLKALEQSLLLGQGPLAGIMGMQSAATGGTGGFLGALFSSFKAGGAAVTPGGIGHAASGGPVAGGRAYIVGENGQELFVPHTSGSIIPNNMLRGGGGGGSSVEINNFVSADTETKQTRQNGPGGERIVVDIVKKAQARGEFDAVNRGRFGVRPQKVR